MSDDELLNTQKPEITASDVEAFMLERRIVQNLLDSVALTNQYSRYEPGKAETVNGILEIAIFNIVRTLK